MCYWTHDSIASDSWFKAIWWYGYDFTTANSLQSDGSDPDYRDLHDIRGVSKSGGNSYSSYSGENVIKGWTLGTQPNLCKGIGGMMRRARRVLALAAVGGVMSLALCGLASGQRISHRLVFTIAGGLRANHARTVAALNASGQGVAATGLPLIESFGVDGTSVVPLADGGFVINDVDWNREVQVTPDGRLAAYAGNGRVSLSKLPPTGVATAAAIGGTTPFAWEGSVGLIDGCSIVRVASGMLIPVMSSPKDFFPARLSSGSGRWCPQLAAARPDGDLLLTSLNDDSPIAIMSPAGHVRVLTRIPGRSAGSDIIGGVLPLSNSTEIVTLGQDTGASSSGTISSPLVKHYLVSGTRWRLLRRGAWQSLVQDGLGIMATVGDRVLLSGRGGVALVTLTGKLTWIADGVKCTGDRCARSSGDGGQARSARFAAGSVAVMPDGSLLVQQANSVRLIASPQTRYLAAALPSVVVVAGGLLRVRYALTIRSRLRFVLVDGHERLTLGSRIGRKGIHCVVLRLPRSRAGSFRLELLAAHGQKIATVARRIK